MHHPYRYVCPNVNVMERVIERKKEQYRIIAAHIYVSFPNTRFLKAIPLVYWNSHETRIKRQTIHVLADSVESEMCIQLTLFLVNN